MLAVIPCLVAASATAPQPPNVLFIVGDDVGYSDFGYFNDQQVRLLYFFLPSSVTLLGCAGNKYKRTQDRCP